MDSVKQTRRAKLFVPYSYQVGQHKEKTLPLLLIPTPNKS